MNDTLRARPGPTGGWDRARRAYRDILGDDDPAQPLLAAGALDLRLGYEVDAVDPDRLLLHSGPLDLVELREIVEVTTGVGTWPAVPAVAGESISARVVLARPASLLTLLMAMEDLIERRSPWGRWRTTVDTVASRVVALESVTVDIRVVEPVV